MTRSRKVQIALAVAVLVLGGVIAFVLTNLDWIVKRAIEKYGSEVVRTAVRVDAVSIGLSKGQGAIRGLTVANPKGFSPSKIFALGLVSMKIEPRSVTRDVIVLDDIRITGTRVLYETDSSGNSNIDALKKNIASGEGQKKKSEKKKEPRLRIRKLVIEDSSLEVRAGDRPKVLALGRVALTDIGGPAGATPEQVAQQIVTAIATEAGKTAAKAGAERLLRKQLEKALNK